MHNQTASVHLSDISIEDRGGFVWGVIGFLSPLLGLILHLVARKSLPKNAAALKTGVILGFIAVACVIFLYVELIALTTVVANSTELY